MSGVTQERRQSSLHATPGEAGAFRKRYGSLTRLLGMAAIFAIAAFLAAYVISVAPADLSDIERLELSGASRPSGGGLQSKREFAPARLYDRAVSTTLPPPAVQRNAKL